MTDEGALHPHVTHHATRRRLQREGSACGGSESAKLRGRCKAPCLRRAWNHRELYSPGVQTEHMQAGKWGGKGGERDGQRDGEVRNHGER